MPDDQTMAKERQRRHARTRRRALGLDPTTTGVRAADHFPVADLVRFAPGVVVAGYRPRGTEVDPRPILQRLETLGARVVLPVVVAAGSPLVFRDAGPWEDHLPDAAGVLAPPASRVERRPDLLIVPLLAFDRLGGRLGQGGGFYDRTLASLRASGPVRAIGLAFAGQEVPRLDLAPHDERLDAILTEMGYIEV